MLAACLAPLLCQARARAGMFVPGDVTAALGPGFFVDDAAAGGGDVTVTQPAAGSYNRSFAGLLNPNQGPTRIAIAGFGFATPNAPAFNTATSLDVSFTYLGADEATGGGDDVPIGSAGGTYQFSGNGEYGFVFDASLTADLNITGTRFLIQVTPTNGTSDGKIRFKTGALTYETGVGAKFSVSGSATPRRLNLAKYQTATTDTSSGQRLASYVTDGVTGNDNRWQSAGSAPHWARVDFPFPVEAGGAQIFSGVDDGQAMTTFKLQYLDDAAWVDVPGASVAGNANVEVNLVFTNPVTASSFRIYNPVDGTVRIRELALYPPNGADGCSVGTDLVLNLAHRRPTVATANTSGNFALLATDGRVNMDSKWQTSTAGSQTLEIDLRVVTKIGSAHLYSGSPGVPPLADFDLKYWDSAGSAWLNIPGGTVAGNNSAALVIPFSSAVSTSKLQLVFTNPGTTSVRELCIFPANDGNIGYPIGTGVTGVPPLAAKFDDFNDAFYRITNSSANLFVEENRGAAVLNGSGRSPAQGQYQILLNHENGSYRLRNRASGCCLSGAQLSTTPGSLLVDAPYSALPDQDWILRVAGGGKFQLVNLWSGLVADTRGGGTDANTALVQNVDTGAASQLWQIVFAGNFPKKGIGAAGSAGSAFATLFDASWMYGWSLATTAILSDGTVFNPMQWGDFNWDATSSAASAWKLYPTWRTTSAAIHLMGFNEPDSWNQSGKSLDPTNPTDEAGFSATRSMQEAVTLWPRLMAMDQPLVAPCPANMTGGWLSSFYTQATDLGYRVDYTAKHSYPGPNGGSSDNLIGELQNGHTLWERPMWLTEFSFVDWNGTGGWSEEDNYNCLAEFLWRAESIPWLRKYALFVFTEDADNPRPAQAWSRPAPAPRSNAIDLNGNLTAFGQLYAAWDNDAVVRTDKTYLIHNKGTRKRLANLTTQTNPDGRNIRIDGGLVHWTLVSAPSGNYYIVSSLDGRRLSYDGDSVSLTASGATGAAVEWSLSESQYGWFFLGHPATSKRLKLAYNNANFVATYTMVADSIATDDVQWRFIAPPPPPAWLGAGDNSWTAAANWKPTAVPATDDVVRFNILSSANLDTILNQDFQIQGVTVTDPSGPVSIGGANALTIGSCGIDLSGASQDLAITAPVVAAAAQVWNVGDGRTLRIDGGASGSFPVTITGAGSVSLGGPCSWSGDTNVAAGATLRMETANVLPNGAGAGNLILGGTLNAGTFANAAGTLAVSGAAKINLGTGASLAFANSSAADWTGGSLEITGTFVSGSSLRFGADASGLTAASLALISAAGADTFALDEDGYLISKGYRLWALANARTGTANDDFDGDGVANAVEYVLGGGKLTQDLGKIPQGIATGGNLVFSFLRDQSSIDGVTTVEIEVGDDPAAWTNRYAVSAEASANKPGVTVTKNSPSGFDTITLTLPLTAGATKFARLKVTP